MKIIVALLVAVLALTACEPVNEEPTAVQPAEAKGSGKTKAKTKATPIKLQARRAKPKASVLSTGEAMSCVKVTVTNQSSKNLDVNPLYFSLTDSKSVKHDTGETLAMVEDQVPTTTLAPKEKATGLVCGKGKFMPKIVAMTNPLFSEAARAEVA